MKYNLDILKKEIASKDMKLLEFACMFSMMVNLCGEMVRATRQPDSAVVVDYANLMDAVSEVMVKMIGKWRKEVVPLKNSMSIS